MDVDVVVVELEVVVVVGGGPEDTAMSTNVPGGTLAPVPGFEDTTMPGANWVDFDPTCGSVGKSALVTVAVVRDPAHALPLHGTFIGTASDPLDMEVHVSVTPRRA